MGLMGAESLVIQVFKGIRTIDDCHLRVSPSLYWLKPGEEIESPHYMLLQVDRRDAFQVLEACTDTLVREGQVRPKTAADAKDWWFAPMWCSYGDQYAPLDGVSGGTVHASAAGVDRPNTHLWLVYISSAQPTRS